MALLVTVSSCKMSFLLVTWCWKRTKVPCFHGVHPRCSPGFFRTCPSSSVEQDLWGHDLCFLLLLMCFRSFISYSRWQCSLVVWHIRLKTFIRVLFLCISWHFMSTRWQLCITSEKIRVGVSKLQRERLSAQFLTFKIGLWNSSVVIAVGEKKKSNFPNKLFERKGEKENILKFKRQTLKGLGHDICSFKKSASSTKIINQI